VPNLYFPAKDKLHNDLVDDLGIQFPVCLPEEEIRRRVMVLVNALWYIDGSHDKINTRCEVDKRIPTRFVHSYTCL